MSTTTKTCIEVECDDCADGWADSDYGTPHFAVGADVAKEVGEWGWTTDDGKHYCPNCSNARVCATEGHQPRELGPSRHPTREKLVMCNRCGIVLPAPASTGDTQ